MGAIDRISYSLNIRSEIPNQQLAKELAGNRDINGIKEIAENLNHKNSNVRSDCLKVLYEIGYIQPELIAPYASDFLSLLNNKQNRMVWGSMIALSTIAKIKADSIWSEIDTVLNTIQKGSVITVVSGVKVLSAVAAHNDTYSDKIFPFLLSILESCLPRDVPTHSESMLVCINAENKDILMDVLISREPELSKAQMIRYKRIIWKISDY